MINHRGTETQRLLREKLKALELCNAFSVDGTWGPLFPGLSLRSNPGLELANAFGVFLHNLSRGW